ncbi:hypothetical protein FY528_15680 [Hymenobacter lutimineralis]|uniref:Uncharacterized protein n=1 Tax=Hymenobacter lutimineralis TaxID=2606448 RepID=A0A5D6UW95_9BACT|nr:hypothetical protein [Hymenobacter lutimineralis]TYZ07255.1 hypothetical protein FY528_15680 [Hymenobacter lutimineralis]
MNYPLLCLLGMLGWPSNSSAQPAPTSAGLYRSAEDFRQNRLTLETPATTASFRVRLHEWPFRPYLTVVHGGRKDTVQKAAVYGYRDADGRTYRLVRNQPFPVLNPTEAVLLYKVEQAPMGKNPGFVRLYFSTTAAAPLQPLTLLHLKRAFPTNYRLHELLDAHFPPGSDLAAWDKFHGTTKLNWLLQRSQAVADAH